MCASLFAGAGAQSVNLCGTKPDFTLMAPGHYVFLRYASEDPDVSDTDVVTWFRVQVVRPGHISETVGEENEIDPKMDGWWCITPPNIHIYKFFVRCRILEIELCL